MYHALLFFHVLSAFFLAAGIVIYSSFALGGPVNRATRLIAEILWGVGGLGTLVFGIWLALNRPEYEIYDGWIIAALVLWFLATGSGAQASRGMRPVGDDSAAGDRPPHRDRALDEGLLVPRPARRHGLEAWRMSPIALIRPHDWTIPLLVHIFGAMLLVGALTLAAVSLIAAWRSGSARLIRLAYMSLFYGALPGYIVFRVGAEWIVSKEHLSDSNLAWIGIGYGVSDVASSC